MPKQVHIQTPFSPEFTSCTIRDASPYVTKKIDFGLAPFQSLLALSNVPDSFNRTYQSAVT